MEENFQEINTNLYLNSSSSQDPPEIQKQSPEEEANLRIDQPSDPPFGIPELKQEMLRLNSAFVFDISFYQKALAHMVFNNLDPPFVSWMYGFCLKRGRPESLDGYFFKVFFDPRLVELYRASLRPPDEKQKIVKSMRCPVCGFEHDSADLACPQCHLPKCDYDDAKAIDWRRLLYSLPEDTRKAYDREMDFLMERSGIDDIPVLKKKRDALMRKYGLG